MIVIVGRPESHIALLFAMSGIARINNIPVDQIQRQYVSFGSFNFSYLQWQNSVKINYQQSSHFYSIYLTLAGAIEHRINQHQTICSDCHTAVMILPGQVLKQRTDSLGEALLISIDANLIEQTIAKLIQRTLKQPVIFDTTINLTDEFGDNLKRFGQFLWQLGSESGSASGLVIEELEQAFLACLVKGLRHTYSEDILHQEAGSLAYHAQRAQKFIETHLEANIRSGDIAASVGICPRMLEKAFACHCDCSPMQYLKRTRLHRIHEELRCAPPGTKVVDVMMRYGFMQGGQFAKAYRQMFGELPSETLKQHRSV